MADEPSVDIIPTPVKALYALLSRENLPVKQDPQVAHGAKYITGETVITVLNSTLGIHNWSFRVIREWWDEAADQVIVHGELTANIPTGLYQSDGTPILHPVVHQQFGGEAVKRSRDKGVPLDLADNYKGAGTDSMKKCATQIGVGLFLARKSPEAFDASAPTNGVAHAERVLDRATPQQPRAAATTRERDPGDQPHPIRGGLAFKNDGCHCEVCGSELKEVPFNDKNWSVEYLAQLGKNKWGHIACWTHYRMLKAKSENKANDLPPEDLWVVNLKPGVDPPSTTQSSAPTAAAGSSTNSRPRPGQSALPTPPQKTRTTALEELKASLTKIADLGSQDPADTEQCEWVEAKLYEAVGQDTQAFMDLLWAKDHALTVGDVDAFEKWMEREPEKWVKRAQELAKLIPA